MFIVSYFSALRQKFGLMKVTCAGVDVWIWRRPTDDWPSQRQKSPLPIDIVEIKMCFFRDCIMHFLGHVNRNRIIFKLIQYDLHFSSSSSSFLFFRGFLKDNNELEFNCMEWLVNFNIKLDYTVARNHKCIPRLPQYSQWHSPPIPILL